jgi:hypothetical protein
MGLLSLAGHAIQRAEATVAVRLKRAHTQFLGQGEGLIVVGFDLVDVRPFVLCSTRTNEVEGVGLESSLLAGTRDLQGAHGER